MNQKAPEPNLDAQPLGWARWALASFHTVLAIVLMAITYVLAGTQFGASFRAQSWLYQAGVAALGGVLVFFFAVWLRDRSLEQRWSDLADSTMAVAPSLVRPALFLILVSAFVIAYQVLTVRTTYKPAYAMAVVGLCTIPAILTTCVALLVERRMGRSDFDFEIIAPVEVPGTTAVPRNKDLEERLKENWNYERGLMKSASERMGRHASILGFLASCILVSCVVIIILNKGVDPLRHHVALAVGTAATISFTLHLGQIFFRSASNDATARMIAWASRTLLIVSICALFFGALFLGDGSMRKQESGNSNSNGGAPSMGPSMKGGEGDAPAQGDGSGANALASLNGATQTDKGKPQRGGGDKSQDGEGNTSQEDGGNPLRGREGALLIGVAVALLGDRILRSVTNRAANLLGVEGLEAERPSDLGSIDGLGVEDAARLAEERIDSVHALAFTPTPRIFFNTVYGLQRICDWQDQALLIERVGRTNALLLREQYFVRGAVAARRYALQKLAGAGAGAADAAGGAQQSSPMDTILNRALLSLVEDRDIERLEVFWRSVPVLGKEAK